MTSAKGKISEKLVVFRGWGRGCTKRGTKEFGGDRILLYLDFIKVGLSKLTELSIKKCITVCKLYLNFKKCPPELQLHISIWASQAVQW